MRVTAVEEAIKSIESATTQPELRTIKGISLESVGKNF
jgi:hypothetical protein